MANRPKGSGASGNRPLHMGEPCTCRAIVMATAAGSG